ncbi:FkbM family methyltransferase [Kordiimonas aquimaris]|uniref:FkbM family methyltransferase n=1 Tax=Kordiimonas aquimaris TaxID=707591 RepID=UPI0021CE0424|nr:FkbM family methyltransferase [Kordiimonas aquimaris]
MFELLQKFHDHAAASGTDVGELFEGAVQKIYEAWLKPGDLAVDVGAHKGAHLFPVIEAVGVKGQIYAFEPIVSMHDNLKRKLKKAGIRNVKLHQLALGREATDAAFSYFENRPAFSGLQRRSTPFDDDEGGLKEVVVKQVMLDSKLPFFRKVSAIKLDIEGGELHALMGAQKCLKKSRPLVVFENGRQASAKVYGYTADDFFQFFNDMDMEVFWLTGEPFLPEQWSKRIQCWEFVALPKEHTGFAAQLPDLCRSVLS